jgi:integrase
MAKKWTKTQYPGVRYREHLTRKHGIRPDKYFTIRFRVSGKQIEEGLGWTSEGWTAEKAAFKLGELKQAARTGTGPASLKEQRAQATAERQDQEREQLTFGEYFQEHYYPTASSVKKPETARKEAEHFKKWLQPSVGIHPLKQIAPIHLEKLKRIMLDAGKSARMIQYVFATFRQCWNMAKRDGLAEKESPTKAVKLPQVKNERIRFLTPDEADRLLDYLWKQSVQLHDICLLSLDCGLRAGEVFNLHWRNVHLADGSMDILGAKAGDRSAYMTERVKEMLARQSGQTPSSLVFRSRVGGKINAVSNAFDRAVNALGFNDGLGRADRKQRVVFHSLRHTFASWHSMGGTDLHVLKELMGHHDIKMTLRYAHLQPATLRGATSNLERFREQDKSADVIPLKNRQST